MKAHRCPKCHRVITYAKMPNGRQAAFDVAATFSGRWTIRDGRAFVDESQHGRLLHVCPERGRG